MNNCGTCKHWKRPEDRTDFRSAVSDGSWSVLGMTFEQEAINEKVSEEADKKFGICEKVYSGTYRMFDPHTSEPLPHALTIDGSDYFSQLMTRVEFGCVLWEATDVL